MCEFCHAAMMPAVCFLGAFAGVMLAHVSLGVLVWLCYGMGDDWWRKASRRYRRKEDELC